MKEALPRGQELGPPVPSPSGSLWGARLPGVLEVSPELAPTPTPAPTAPLELGIAAPH